MKRSISDLALFGGAPISEEGVPVGQLYLPEWSEFEDVFEGIFDRQYFTNHGPLVQSLDKEFAAYLGVRNAVSVTNGTVSLMVAAKALELRGEVIVPAFTFPATVQALNWAGLTPVFCDVDPFTHNLTAKLVEPLITEATSAVLGVHLWGRQCDVGALTALCNERGLALVFDAAHAIGCTFDGHKIGRFGRVESFSFHATKVLNGAEGGCLTTDDDDLAARIRTVRNFHVSESFAAVNLRINAKMSEAQAGMALLGLRHLQKNIKRNRELYEAYRMRAGNWAGIHMVDVVGREASNYQYCVFEVDESVVALSRDELCRLLAAEGVLARRYFYPGVHRVPPYSASNAPVDRLPNTEHLCQVLFQLPIGAGVSLETVQQIADSMDCILRWQREIARRMAHAA